MWFGFQIGAGLALFGVALALCTWLLGFVVDLCDARSSRLSPDDATRRAKLTSLGKWPPLPARPWSTLREWIWLMAGLLVIALTALVARRWSQ